MRSKLAILLTVCAAVLAINLDTTIVNVALPSISSELDAGTRQLQWIVDGYNLAFAALVLAAGSLSDRYGRRPALILGLLGFAAASVAGALSTRPRRWWSPGSRWAPPPRSSSRPRCRSSATPSATGRSAPPRSASGVPSSASASRPDR